jgi:hypothetical protein
LFEVAGFEGFFDAKGRVFADTKRAAGVSPEFQVGFLEGFDDVRELVEEVGFLSGPGGDIVERRYSDLTPFSGADGELFVAVVVRIEVAFFEFSFESCFGPAAFLEEEVAFAECLLLRG